MRILTILLCLVFISALGGCGTGSMVVLLPDLDGNVGQVVVETEGGQRVLTEAHQSAHTTGRKSPPSEVTTLSTDEIRSAFSEVLAAQPPPPAKFILYFVKDSNILTGESSDLLPKIIRTIQERQSADIVISGHTDTVGEKAYNYKLSIERAKMIYDTLVANGAVPANITVTSHGEGNPLIKTKDNVAEPRNRRVEVVIK